MKNSEQRTHSLNGTFSVVYKTMQGKLYPLEFGFAVVPDGHIPVDVRATEEACRKGCRLYGRNGGCPPFAPQFHEISGSDLLVLYAKLLTKHFPPKVLNGPFFSRWVFVETFMTPLTNRIGRALAPHLGAYFLSSGNCQVCRPKRCAVKDSLPCRKPQGRTFSLEATGVLVTEMMKNAFGIELQWWQRDNSEHVPDYMVKVVALKGENFLEKGCEPKVIKDALIQNRISVQSTVAPP